MTKYRVPQDYYNIDEDMARIAKELQEEIDAQVLISVMRDSGWFKVVLREFNVYTNPDIDVWCRENNLEYHRFKTTFMFKNEADATMFRLRWI